jgi:exonuclease VII small subunit
MMISKGLTYFLIVALIGSIAANFYIYSHAKTVEHKYEEALIDVEEATTRLEEAKVDLEKALKESEEHRKMAEEALAKLEAGKKK